MSGESAATRLGEVIVERPHFRDVLGQLESAVASAFLTGESADVIESDVVIALLRYADLLSHSDLHGHQDLAYSVIALLHEYEDLVGLDSGLSDQVLAVSEAILVKLGNFPGIETLQKGEGSKFALPLSRALERAVKEVHHATASGKSVLTDSQYEIASQLRDADFFSFSGPTSLGKSFILKDLLYDVMRRAEMDGTAVVVLVPTKALVNQAATDLRRLFRDVPAVNVATYPVLHRILRDRHPRSVFVLTPERLIRYLASPVRPLRYLIVDEAQKVVADRDSRSPLYYHAILESTQAFATRLIFSSPAIANPELFLDLFQKSNEGSIAVRTRTVAQQRYFVDLVEGAQFRISSLSGEAASSDLPLRASSSVGVITQLTGDRKAIVYVNSTGKASELALELAHGLPVLEDSALKSLGKYVEKYVHKDYFLAECLKRGVAFHHGKMPQEVREKLEALFASPGSSLRYMVCTSTLLEGVNLPAKNIFIMSDKHGTSQLGKIDFDNLAGRAGRLTFDFSGNVVVVRDDPNRWASSTRGLLNVSEPVRVSSFLTDKNRAKRKNFTDMARILRGEDLPKGTSADAARTAQHYASVLLVHHLDARSSPLRNTFIDRVAGGSTLLDDATRGLSIPATLLRRSPSILPVFQDRVWRMLNSGATVEPLLSDGDPVNADTFHAILRRLADLYDWRSQESRGNDSLVSQGSAPAAFDRRLRYWAILMNSWVRGLPLSLIIRNALDYYRERGQLGYRNYAKGGAFELVPFDPASRAHINIVIEETLRNLETGLRFKIIGYLQNYQDLSRAALGTEATGISVADLIEYGTTDARVVELQEIGFSRGVANRLIEEFSDYLSYDEAGVIAGIDARGLMSVMEPEEDAYIEVDGLFGMSAPTTGPAM
ncbi:DEAD/DEAH box helicase [Cellulomonas sp. ACRRI]|uniref:DEAD/DEAH box helicase n=1 Tax=Cellulomonas sp. ACRRI TaxID=2918188 RepID=UPI001EF2A528|nr:DEAD/DEAH box helicase [Cellulomonas sp. ACRRI]MCG7286385.1 DEAD/DEAH box helicase [Cellulomonas sp. ACRRI]